MNSSLDIVIPTFNSSLTLADTLESCKSYAKDGANIIVSDNGSSDSTLEIINEYKSKYDLKVVFNHHSNDPVSNWINGLNNSKSHFVKLLFSDDMFLDDAPYSMKRFHDNHGFLLQSIFIGPNSMSASLSHKRFYSPSRIGIFNRFNIVGKLQLLLHKWPYMSPCAAFFRRNDLVKALELSLTFSTPEMLKTGAGPDLFCFMYMLHKYKKYRFIHESKMFFREHDDSFSCNSTTTRIVQECYLCLIQKYRKGMLPLRNL